MMPWLFDPMTLSTWDKIKGWFSDTGNDVKNWIQDTASDVGDKLYDAIVQPIIDWLLYLLYQIFSGMLSVVDACEDAFHVFSGTSRVEYKGVPDYLINIFFGSNAVSRAFWGVCAIAVVLTFVFTILAVARKTVDIEGTVKNSVGEIVTKAFKTCLTLLLVSSLCIASLRLTSTVFIQIDDIIKNSTIAQTTKSDTKVFTETEITVMSDVLETVARYSTASKKGTDTYGYPNVNACFNDIREDLILLKQYGIFEYDYTPETLEYTVGGAAPYTRTYEAVSWQYALFKIADSRSNKLTEDIPLTEKDTALIDAMNYAFSNIGAFYFEPVKRVQAYPEYIDIKLDRLLFVTATLKSPETSQLYAVSFDDPKRLPYIKGPEAKGGKDYRNYETVKKDFDMSPESFDYFTPMLLALVFVVVLGICILVFIARLFELVFLYIMAPIFCSVSPLDGGEKFKSWMQTFVIKLVTGFGGVYIMRIYMMMVPIIVSNDLILFESSFGNWLAKMLLLLGGAFAVLKGNTLLTGIVANTPGVATMSENAISGYMVGHATGYASSGVKSGVTNTINTSINTVKGVGSKAYETASNVFRKGKSK